MKCDADKKVTQIRNRASYLLFQQLYEFLNKKPTVADILRKFHDVLDARRSFGSKQNAEYAVESLDLVLEDNEYCWLGEKHKKPTVFEHSGDENGNHS